MDTPTLSAAEAASLLGVRRTTLYTYVSRGWLRSLPGRTRRDRRYLRAEVEALRARSEAGRGHRAVASGAIHWGQPVVDTRISDTSPDGPRYRGRPAQELLTGGFEATCAWLWESDHWPSVGAGAVALPRPPDASVLACLAALVSDDWRSAHRGPSGVEAAARLVRRCALAVSGVEDDACSHPIAELLAAGWGSPDAATDIDAALVWCADHGLNASTFAARVTASTGAGLHAVVLAGLAALSGPRHGAASARLARFLDEVERRAVLQGDLAGATRDTVAAWQGQAPCLGHPLYPDGDPRGADLLDRAAAVPMPCGTAHTWLQVLDTLLTDGHPPPDLDFGLLALARSWRLGDEAAQVMFAIGRMAGWVAHMHEERGTGRLIRPRSRYRGARSG